MIRVVEFLYEAMELEVLKKSEMMEIQILMMVVAPLELLKALMHAIKTLKQILKLNKYEQKLVDM